jgi:hypothetical protein
VPIANTIELLGEVIAAAGVPFRSIASGNTVTYQVQYASEVAVSGPTSVGVASFDSAFFDVDATGFVTFNGSSLTELQVDTHTFPGTDPVQPLAGVITVTGAQVAAGVIGTNVIRTDSLAANTMTIEIQRSSAQAATALSTNGVCHFNSASFGVDANGFVTASGTGLVQALQGNSGGVIYPTAGVIQTVGSGSITAIGAGSTITFELTALNNHAVLVGAGTSTITSLGPTATIGQVLQSAGASADPAFSTATYPLTTTVNQLLYSSATNTVTGLATANRAVLTTNATGVPALTALATDGQLIIGSTAGVPSAATLTAGVGVAITNGPNSISIALSGGGVAIDSFTPDSGTSPVVPNVNGLVAMTGGNGIATVGGTNILTFDMESPFTGDFNFQSVTSGDTETLTVINTSNTASSQAQYVASVAGASAGDAFSTYTVAGVTSWSLGVDNSASDGFAIASSTVLGTSNWLQSTTAGIVTLPNKLRVGDAVTVVDVDAVVQKETIGGFVELEVRNTDNTNTASNAIIGIVVGSVGGANSGDPFITYNIAATQNWSHGIDNSASDSYKLSASNALGTTDVMISTVAGATTWPLQPAFLASIGAALSNVTGDGTQYVIVWNTEVFDNASNFSSPTFTAPVTGKYNLSTYASQSLASAVNTTAYFRIVTSNRTYLTDTVNPFATKDIVAGFNTLGGSALADMDTGDTATCTTQWFGGALNINVAAGWFSGNLTC